MASAFFLPPPKADLCGKNNEERQTREVACVGKEDLSRSVDGRFSFLESSSTAAREFSPHARTVKTTVSYDTTAYADPEIACSTTPVAYWQLQCTGISVCIKDRRVFDEAREKNSRTR